MDLPDVQRYMDLSLKLTHCYLLMSEQDRRRRERRRRRRRFWQHPIVELRQTQGSYASLYGELQANPEKFADYTRMSQASFDYLLERVGGFISRQDTWLRLSISAEERLLVTLRFLATGESLSSLHFQFRIGISTLSGIIADTCRAIADCLHADFLTPPTTQTWLDNAAKYNRTCQFPNCVGAVDGKHIRIIKPSRTGSEYFNYKKYFSVLLMAIADADCRFVAVDIGSFGRGNDSQTFRRSDMGQRLYGDNFQMPPPQPLPGTPGPPMPFVLVGDEAFQMCGNLLKPYSSMDLNHTKRIYNYRLTRARRTVECAFGILTAKWRILGTAINLKPTTIDQVVRACVVLHNFILVRERLTLDLDDIPATPLPNFCPIAGRSAVEVLSMRDQFAEFFVSDIGSVPWQETMI